MYIAVSIREEQLILEAVAKFLNTKNTRIKPKLIKKVGSKITTTSLALQSSDDATTEENFGDFCKILGLRRGKLRLFESGIGNSVIFALAYNVVRVYSVQNLGKDNIVREFEKGVKSVYPMTSKVKDYVHESTVDCLSIERFLYSLSVPITILTQDEFFAEIKFKSISVNISKKNSKQNSNLTLLYSGI